MSARRCLFGRPTAEQRLKTKNMLETAFKRMRQEESQRWGFDFDLGMPLPDSGFIYEVMPENTVPEFYRLKVITVASSTKSLDLPSTTLTPLSSPSTSDKEENSLLETPNSSFEEEPSPKKWQFREPPTPRKSPMKRQQKMTDYMAVSRKKNSLSPNKLSPQNVIFTPKSRRHIVHTRSPY